MNVVVYVSDALRSDHVGCYGARHVRTPTIDAFAAGGVRFDQAISAAPWTCPSTTSMITGLYPHHHGHLHWDVPVDPGLPTLFTAAAARGLTTASFVFDENYLFKGFPHANVVGTSEKLDGVVEWLRAHRTEPFVLWFHNWETHMPYDILHAERKEWLAAKEEIIEGIQSDSASALEHLRQAYCDSVERSSEVMFAGFLEELEALGLRDDTAVVFLSDHGESWGERFENKEDVKGTFHMHGATLHDEIVEVPLIVSAPELAPGVVRSQVSLVDLTPTLLQLLGAPGVEADGTSLLDESERPALIAGTDKGALSQLAIREPPWKLILHVESGEEEAYRLDLDPRELHPRDDAPPELRERLFAELESAERRELSAEEEELVTGRLRDLGYL